MTADLGQWRQTTSDAPLSPTGASRFWFEWVAVAVSDAGERPAQPVTIPGVRKRAHLEKDIH